MKEFSITITDPIWMQPGTTASFVEKMKSFSSDITVLRGGSKGNGKEFYGVMKLKPLNGDITTIKAEGADENVAIKTVEDFFKNNL